jgi:hypothetical protein
MAGETAHGWRLERECGRANMERPLHTSNAWAGNPAAANLTDETGLPAWPFRTDDWPAMP